MTTTLGSLLRDHPANHDDPLVHSREGSYSKGEILERVETLSAQLAELAPGAPVAVVADGVDALVGMFAAWARSAVLVPVNPRLPAAGIEEIVESCDAAAVVQDGAVTYRRSTTHHRRGTAFVLWTSGTGGAPTPILHHHDAYLEIIDRVLEPLAATRNPSKAPSPNLIPVSMALNAGIYNALFGLRAGAPLVLMDRFDTTTFANLVHRHHIRSTVLPPAAIVMLNGDPHIANLEPLRYVRSITAPLSPFHARRFRERFGVFVLNGYGQAELGEVIGWTAADAKAHPERVGAVGRPHPGVSIRLDAADPEGVGELQIQPPVSPSDGVQEALGDRLDIDGYVRTGDLARVDEAGFVWIEGRVSDVINRGGNKVFPDQVEEVLATVAGVRDVAVVGRPDERLGEVPVAFVVGEVPDDELVAACRSQLAPYKVPVRFERVPSIPRNAVGKILRRELSP